MTPQVPPHWLLPGTVAQARIAQAEMAARAVTQDALPAHPRIGAADVSNTRYDPYRRVHAALVTLDAAGGVVATASESRAADFPYVPGYLGFREVPALVAAWARLDPKPGLLLVDGQGLAHPRGMGLATHLGVMLDVPTIGVAKSLLVGEGEPDPEPGDAAPILWKGARIGVALRTRRGDIPALIEVLAEDMLHRGSQPPELTPAAVALLAAQHWRGNIRELRNVLEQAALRADAGALDAEPMEALLRQSGLSLVQPALPPEPPPQDAAALLRPLGEQVAELERRAIAAALQATHGNKLAAARLLGISRATLYGRLLEPGDAPQKP